MCTRSAGVAPLKLAGAAGWEMKVGAGVDSGPRLAGMLSSLRQLMEKMKFEDLARLLTGRTTPWLVTW